MIAPNLSTLALVLGLGFGLPQIYGLLNPGRYAAKAREFPRSLACGYVFMALGTVWFLYNLSLESVADFERFKNLLMALFAAIGLFSCVFVQDFLAVRGFAVVLLLLARLMVDTGRPYLPQTSWVLVFQGWAYVMVVAGIWFTISPWRMRDLIVWGTANEQRIRVGCGLRLAFGLLVAALGATVFKSPVS